MCRPIPASLERWDFASVLGAPMSRRSPGPRYSPAKSRRRCIAPRRKIGRLTPRTPIAQSLSFAIHATLSYLWRLPIEPAMRPATQRGCFAAQSMRHLRDTVCCSLCSRFHRGANGCAVGRIRKASTTLWLRRTASSSPISSESSGASSIFSTGKSPPRLCERSSPRTISPLAPAAHPVRKTPLATAAKDSRAIGAITSTWKPGERSRNCFRGY